MKLTFSIALLKTFNFSTNSETKVNLKKLFSLFIIFSFLFAPTLTFGQEKKPKVALVLSGGGAKGIAHIPLLQKLDSLGIVPDMVLGTSMGSIVGGLYAMGYSGDSIAKMTKNANWDELLGGSISLSKVSIEEKSEFKRYLIDLDLKEGKPKVSSSLLNDQNLREYLSSLVYPVHNINDFDNLPIPYRAIATDLVNGKEVIMDEGSLAVAMRASMSIPSVFRPVPYKGTLLVDGGVLNNFPTDVAKKMGADIIIGSDVGGGMSTIEELDNIPTILFQTSMLTSNLKNPEHQKNCDILLNHVPHITFSTGDFAKSNEIFEEGKLATQINLNKLIDLAEKLKDFNQRTHQLPHIDKEFVLDTISYAGISKNNIELVKARANIKTNVKYTVQDIIDGINRAMGTNLFSQITTKYIAEGNKIGLQINGFEHSKNQIKSSLHFDTYRGIGIIMNYTGRNILGNASRLIATIDVAEQPRLRISYQKIFGTDKSWWWKSELYGEKLRQKYFIDGNFVEDIRFRSIQFDNQINKNLNSLKSYVGLGLNYQNTRVRPRSKPEFSQTRLDLYKFNNFELYAQYIYNNMSQVFYATSGTFFHANIARSFLHNVDLTYYNDENNNELPNIEPIEGNTNGFTKFALNFEKRLPFKNKITGIVGATSSFIFQDQLKSNDIPISDYAYGYAVKYSIGGNLLVPKRDAYILQGLYEGELNATQFVRLHLGMQFNPVNKVYLTPNLNIASVGFGTFNDYLDGAFTPGNQWQDHLDTSLLMTLGTTISYHSFLGPVNFDVSYVNDINKVRLFFSVGFVFNPSIR